MKRVKTPLIFLCIVVVAFMSACTENKTPVLGKIPRIARDAQKDVRAIERNMKDAEDRLDLKAYAEADKRLRETKAATLNEMNEYIKEKGGVLSVPFEQGAHSNTFEAIEARITEVAWNPGTPPHVNLSIRFVAQRRISDINAQAQFLNSEGDVVYSDKLFFFRPQGMKEGETNVLRANPFIEKIAPLAKVLIN